MEIFGVVKSRRVPSIDPWGTPLSIYRGGFSTFGCPGVPTNLILLLCVRGAPTNLTVNQWCGGKKSTVLLK